MRCGRDTEPMRRLFGRLVNNARVLRAVFQMVRSGQFGRRSLSNSLECTSNGNVPVSWNACQAELRQGAFPDLAWEEGIDATGDRGFPGAPTGECIRGLASRKQAGAQRRSRPAFTPAGSVRP